MWQRGSLPLVAMRAVYRELNCIGIAFGGDKVLHKETEHFSYALF
jgi:hypothetical protein